MDAQMLSATKKPPQRRRQHSLQQTSQLRMACTQLAGYVLLAGLGLAQLCTARQPRVSASVTSAAAAWHPGRTLSQASAFAPPLPAVAAAAASGVDYRRPLFILTTGASGAISSVVSSGGSAGTVSSVSITSPDRRVNDHPTQVGAV